MADISTAESRQIKLSPSGIPLEDEEYFYGNEKTQPQQQAPFPNHHMHQRYDDEHIIYDGGNSQIDLVEYASKH